MSTGPFQSLSIPEKELFNSKDSVPDYRLDSAQLSYMEIQGFPWDGNKLKCVIYHRNSTKGDFERDKKRISEALDLDWE